MSTASSPEKPIHQRLIAVEYKPSGVAIDDRIGDIASRLGQQVVSTACERLVRSAFNNQRCIRGWEPNRKDRKSRLPALVCKVPCEQDDLPDDFFVRLPNNMTPRAVRRGKIRELVRFSIFAAKTAMDGTEFFRPDEGSESSVVFLSGPEPVHEQDLRDDLMGLQMHFRDTPESASAYVSDLQQFCAEMFAQVTGGTIPLISCEIDYATL